MSQKLLLIGIVLVTFFTSCNKSIENKQENSTNALIPKEVVITYEHNLNIVNQTIFKAIDRTKLVDLLVDNSLKGDKPIISAFDNESVLPLSEINRQIGSYQDTVTKTNEETGEQNDIINTVVFPKENLQRIVFNEKWFFNEQDFVMTKEVIRYAPISVFYKSSDTLKTDLIKKLLFWYNYKDKEPKNTSGMLLIGENISYEFELYNGRNQQWLENLSVTRFLEIIINRAVEENKNVFDYFDKQPLSREKVKENLGETREELFVEDQDGNVTDTVVSVYNFDRQEIMSMIFVEDWYLDTTDLRIYKKVKEIAPVRVFNTYDDKGNQDVDKKIPFVLKLN